MTPAATARVGNRDATRSPVGDRPGEGDLSRPLRICLLGYRSNPHSGGQGIYLRYLSQALVRAGHKVDVVSGPPYPELVPSVRLIRIPSLDLHAAPNRLLALRPRHLRSWTDLYEWSDTLTGGFPEPRTFGRRALDYLLRHRDDYDLIHDNQSLCNALLQLRSAGIPTVSTIHHPITHDLKIALESARNRRHRLLIRRWYSFIAMQRRVVRNLDHVVTVSECSREAIEKAFAIEKSRISVVHNGIDTHTFQPQPATPRPPQHLVATASADAPLKGLDYLLHAVAQLRRNHPGLTLTVVGRPRPGGHTEKTIRALELGEAVTFRNGISTRELVALYARATIAVVPSLYEGFGLPAGEAMACGVPVVSTTGGALGEVVGDAGVLVPPADAPALARAIAGLLDDGQQRRRLGALARQRITREFSWDVAGEKMTAYYRQILGNHAHHRTRAY